MIPVWALSNTECNPDRVYVLCQFCLCLCIFGLSVFLEVRGICNRRLCYYCNLGYLIVTLCPSYFPAFLSTVDVMLS